MLLIRRDGVFPFLPIIAEHAAEEPREISGDGIASAGGRIDDPGDAILREKDVVVPNVSQHRKQRHFT